MKLIGLLSLLPVLAASAADPVPVSDQKAGSTWTSGNHVELKVDGPDFYPVRLEQIATAQRSIDLWTYLWCDDQTGLESADALIAAHQRGVRVRVIVDLLNLLKHKEVYRRVRAAGIPILEFNPEFWREKITHRLHEKFQVTDGKHVMIGGANLCDEYMRGKPNPTKPIQQLWHDLELHATGPIAATLQADFDRSWNEIVRRERRARARWAARDNPVRPSRSYEIPYEPTPLDLTVTGDHRALSLHQQPYFFKGQNDDFVDLYSNLVRTAKRSVVIYQPYFLPRPAFEAAILEVARRGIDITVMTNSEFSNDMGWALSAAALGRYPLFMNAGVKLFEIQDRSLHAKAILIDDQWLTVGSHNYTHRSFGENGEASLLTDSRPAIERFQRMWAEDIASGSFKTVTPQDVLDRTDEPGEKFKLFLGSLIRKQF